MGNDRGDRVAPYLGDGVISQGRVAIMPLDWRRNCCACYG